MDSSSLDYCITSLHLWSIDSISLFEGLRNHCMVTFVEVLSLFLSLLVFSLCSNLEWFTRLGFSCCGITGTVVLSCLPISSSAGDKPFSNGADL